MTANIHINLIHECIHLYLIGRRSIVDLFGVAVADALSHDATTRKRLRKKETLATDGILLIVFRLLPLYASTV